MLFIEDFNSRLPLIYAVKSLKIQTFAFLNHHLKRRWLKENEVRSSNDGRSSISYLPQVHCLFHHRIEAARSVFG